MLSNQSMNQHEGDCVGDENQKYYLYLSELLCVLCDYKKNSNCTMIAIVLQVANIFSLYQHLIYKNYLQAIDHFIEYWRSMIYN